MNNDASLSPSSPSSSGEVIISTQEVSDTDKAPPTSMTSTTTTHTSHAHHHYQPQELGLQMGGNIYRAINFFVLEEEKQDEKLLIKQRQGQQTIKLPGPDNRNNSRPGGENNNNKNSDVSNHCHLVKLLMIGDSGTGKQQFLSRLSHPPDHVSRGGDEQEVLSSSDIHTIGLQFQVLHKHVWHHAIYSPPERLPVAVDSKGVPTIPGSHLNKAPIPEADSDLSIHAVKCQIWDTASQERFRLLSTTYYKGAHGIWIFYDICDRDSFQNVKSWLQEIQKHANPEVVVMLIGTKEDIAIDEEQSQEKLQDVNRDRRKDSRQITFEQGLELAQQFHLSAFLEVSCSKFDCHVQDALATMVGHVLKQRLLPSPPIQDHKKSDCVIC